MEQLLGSVQIPGGGMSKGWVAGCPQLLASGGSPATCTGGSSPSQGNAAHATWRQCPGAALVQATTTGMEFLCAPAAAPAGPAALGDMVDFSLRQAGSTGEIELVLPTSVPRGVPTQEHPSQEDGHPGEF